MAQEKNINSRIQQKTDSTENWAKATGFIPKRGEIIVYQDNGKSSIKIGDGKTAVVNLPFSKMFIVENEYDLDHDDYLASSHNSEEIYNATLHGYQIFLKLSSGNEAEYFALSNCSQGYAVFGAMQDALEYRVYAIAQDKRIEEYYESLINTETLHGAKEEIYQHFESIAPPLLVGRKIEDEREAEYNAPYIKSEMELGANVLFDDHGDGYYQCLNVTNGRAQFLKGIVNDDLQILEIDGQAGRISEYTRTIVTAEEFENTLLDSVDSVLDVSSNKPISNSAVTNALTAIPTIYHGTEVPSNNFGNIGDLYIMCAE